MNLLLKRAREIWRAEVRDWPVWWASLSNLRRYGAVSFVAAYWAGLAAVGDLRSDHLLIGGVLASLSIGGRTANAVLRFVFPLLLTGILYDSKRYYGHYFRREVYVELPYAFDLRFFGVETPEGRLTPNEYWQKHTHAFLDFICGIFYLGFIAIYISISVWHVFLLPRRTKDPVQRRRAEVIGPYVMWAFFWVNMLGYSTYYWFPAAPPWYVTLHGLGPAIMTTLPNAAGALRFDELLGIHIFQAMYSKGVDVFGAIPSLHIAYPMLSLLFAFHLRSLRLFAIFFYAIMCFAAVYLNHHYILDLLWGTAYSILIYLIMRAVAKRRAFGKASLAEPAP